MKLIIAYIQPDRLPAVKEALFESQIRAITVTNALGRAGEDVLAKSFRGVTEERDLLVSRLLGNVCRLCGSDNLSLDKGRNGNHKRGENCKRTHKVSPHQSEGYWELLSLCFRNLTASSGIIPISNRFDSLFL